MTRMIHPRTGLRVDIPPSLVAEKKLDGYTLDTSPDSLGKFHRDLPGLYRGRAAFIAGCGPSMAMTTPEAIETFVAKENAVVWAVNDAWRVCGGLPIRSDYLVVLDREYWYRHKSSFHQYLAADPTTRLVTCWQLNESREYQRILIPLGILAKHKPAYRLNKYFHGQSGGVAAIQMAMHAGCTRIYLLGHDLTSANGKTHGYGVRTESEATRQYPQGATMLSGYELLADHAKELGVSIVNLSPCSAIKCFPRADDLGLEK